MSNTLSPAQRHILSSAPFDLDKTAMDWVARHLYGLDLDEKLGQLFNLRSAGYGDEAQPVTAKVKPGGVTRFFGPDHAAETDLIAGLQADSKVPMLISADLEGSVMSLPFGTQMPNPLALAAIDDLDATRTVSQIMAQEARAVGVNWSFTPVLDINAAFRSAIVATRGYGSDPQKIKRHALAQLQVFQDNGIAATVKHWPGEGFDDRDQHLVTTVIPLSVDEWWAQFGALYQSAIDTGVKSVMSAHIAFPAYVTSVAPGADTLERHQPASINPRLNQTLLRDTMGFNGVIVSDASSMAGLASVSPRAQHVPQIIENGCDMILFSATPDADLDALHTALTDGSLSMSRVDAAVLRVLALKASLGLHLPQTAPALPDPDQARDTIRPIMQRAPTLVKDVQNILPLSPERTKHIYVYTTGVIAPMGPPRPLAMIEMLRAEGFEVTVHDPDTPRLQAWQDADLVLYLMAEETLLTRERIFMNWAGLTGGFIPAMERPWHDTPCALISFGYPYYLYDAPRMPCVINAYMAAEIAQEAVLENLMGRAPFTSATPVDPFCGQDIARY